MSQQPGAAPRSISLSANRPAMSFAIGFFCLSVVIMVVHFLFYRYSFPPNNIDEASFMSPARDLSDTGTFSSSIHAGLLPGADHCTYWVPPLYMLLLAGVFKVFGVTVLNGKLFSFFLVALGAFLITYMSDDLYVKICLAGLVLICPYILASSALMRMESLAIPLLTAAIVAVKFQVQTYWLALLAAAMALTHPMLLPCSAALTFYAWRRGGRPFIVFCLVALIAISPYLIYIFRDIPDFKLQMGLQLARKAHKKLLDVKLDYLLQFLPLSLIALYALTRLRKAKELRLVIGVALTLTSLLIVKSSEINYQVYVMPFIIAVAGMVLDEMSDRPLFRYGVPLALYGVFGFFLVAKLVKYRFTSDKPYTKVLGYLRDHREGWQDKHIFVDGHPDVASFFLMNHQNVQRRNAVAADVKAHLLDTYDYAVEVIDNSSNEKDLLEGAAWRQWPDRNTFTTTDGHFSVTTYSKH
jgi:hypothetical protein